MVQSFGFFGMMAAAMLASDGPGMRPLPDAHGYAANVHVPNAIVAVTALSTNEVKNSFAADLNKGYVVLEVAVYPDHDGNVKISPEDFMLKFAGQGQLIRPAEPAVVASTLGGKTPTPSLANRRSTIDVVPTASIGRISEVYTDPNTGQRKHDSGWVTSTGAEVYGPVGAPGAAAGPTASPRDRETIEAELADKSLPEGTIARPTAGYLYFPAPKKGKKDGAYELNYLGQSSNIKLTVPPPSSR